MTRFLYMVILFAVIYFSYKLTHFLLKRFRLNRWVLLSIIPFILIVPILTFNHIADYLWLFLLLLLTIVSVMFCETSRYYNEHKKIKSMAYHPIKKSE